MRFFYFFFGSSGLFWEFYFFGDGKGIRERREIDKVFGELDLFDICFFFYRLRKVLG